MNLLKTVESAFRLKRWRLTAGVRNVVTILEAQNTPLSPYEIQKQLLVMGRELDVSTIYRIIEKLTKSRAVHSVERRFFKCSSPQETQKQHHFLLCEKCGQAEEIYLDYESSIGAQLATEKNFILKQVTLSFSGICAHCHSGN
jgi:Fe2+ or Zn2+ uptake regulation protein